MKERPILFSTEMVKAILDGRKTMTRRIVKPQPPEDWGVKGLHIFCDGNYFPIVIDKHGNEEPGTQCFGAYDEEGIWGVKCLYGQISDVLWVRETYEIYQGKYKEHHGMVMYKASEKVSIEDGNKFGEKPKWRPSIFMPKSASRISLRITNIRVERLNDISEEDAKKEGVIYSANPGKENYGNGYRANFRLLWESINGKGSWEQNPWVWVIEFERLK